MEEIIKVAIVAIVGALLAVAIKKDNPTGSFMVALGVMVVIIYFTSSVASPVISFINELSDAAGLSPAILAPLFKTLGIAIVTKIAAEACRDAEQKAIAAYAEIAGTMAALYVTLPLLSAVFAMVKSLLV